MNEIKLSIIIPHYNYPDGLKRLLNSIPKRDDVEAIVGDYSESYRYIGILFMGAYFSCITSYLGGIYVAHKETKSICFKNYITETRIYCGFREIKYK